MYTDEKWVGIDETANHLDVNKDTIRTVSYTHLRAHETDIPAHRIGRQWKFKLSEVDEWVKSGKSALE